MDEVYHSLTVNTGGGGGWGDIAHMGHMTGSRRVELTIVRELGGGGGVK